MNEPTKMVLCEDCQTEHREGHACPICAPLARLMQATREKRRQWRKPPKREQVYQPYKDE